MADYNISAEITADASGFESGIKKAQKASKNLSKSVSGVIQGLGKNGLVGALGAVGLASQGLTATLGAVTKIAKKVAQTVDECSQAYRKQCQAEIALSAAVNNNPYIDGTATKRLKEFASEMQRVSDIGDETLIPMMADLIAKGRTEDETMQIMSVALDMSAGGVMSLDTAIAQLNATLNGNVGRLGQQNAELKDLTEEELKQGKAVEILGAKYKGLAQATADSQKQLRNAVGDLKENLGKIFETALAPMRKFFTEVISNLNDVLKKSADVKKAMKDVFSEENIDIKAPTDSLQIALDETLKKQREVTANYSQYIQLYGKYIDQTTDETVKAYKEQISDLNKQIKTLSEELIKRRKESDAQAKARKEAEANAEEEKQINDLKEKYLKLIAEQEAKWANIKKVTGETVKNEERLKFYQEQLVAIMTESGGKITENNQYYKDQMAIIQGIISEIGNPEYKSDWSKKLLDQQIEILEAEKEQAMETGEGTYEIEKYYNDKLLTLRLQRIENEREEALENENLSAEDKLKVNEYYDKEVKKVYDELKKKKKKDAKEEEEEEENKFSKMLAIAKQYAQNVKQVFSKIVSTIKNVFSSIGNIFSKALNLFEFDPDKALDSLLKIEDTILTFFVETLPRMPNFFASAIQSIIVLIKTLMNSIDWSNVQNVVNSIIDMLVQNAPAIIEDLLILVLNIAQTLINAIIHFVESGGWKKLLDLLLMIQQRIEIFVTDNIDDIVQAIVDALPDLIQFLVDSIISASKTLQKLIRPIIKLVLALVEAILELLSNEDVIDTAIDTLIDLGEAIMGDFIPAFIKLIVKAIPKIIPAILKNMPKIVKAFVQGLVNSFTTVNWFEVIKDCFMGFIDAFKDLFGIHSPSTLFEEFGGYMIEGLWNGIKNFGGWLWDNIKNLFTNIIDGISDIFSSIGGKVSGAGSGIKNAFGNVKDFFSGLGEDIKNAFNGIGEKFKSVFSTASNNMKLAFSGVGDWFKSAFSTVSTNVSNAFSNFGNIAKSAWSNIKNGFGDVGSWFKSTFSNAVTNIKSAFSGLSTWFQSLATVINNVFSVCATNLKNVMKSAGNYIKSLAEDIVDGLSSVGGTIKDAVSTAGSKIKSFFGFANGTQSAPRGLALVGEAGPELVRFRGGEQVINNRNTQKLLSDASGTTVNQNITFNNLQDTTAFTMIQQLKQYNRQMAINSII